MLNFISRRITFGLGYQPSVVRKILLVDVKLHCDLQGYMGESTGCACAAALSRPCEPPPMFPFCALREASLKSARSTKVPCLLRLTGRRVRPRLLVVER